MDMSSLLDHLKARRAELHEAEQQAARHLSAIQGGMAELDLLIRSEEQRQLEAAVVGMLGGGGATSPNVVIAGAKGETIATQPKPGGPPEWKFWPGDRVEACVRRGGAGGTGPRGSGTVTGRLASGAYGVKLDDGGDATFPERDLTLICRPAPVPASNGALPTSLGTTTPEATVP